MPGRGQGQGPGARTQGKGKDNATDPKGKEKALMLQPFQPRRRFFAKTSRTTAIVLIIHVTTGISCKILMRSTATRWTIIMIPNLVKLSRRMPPKETKTPKCGDKGENALNAKRFTTTNALKI